MPSGISAKEIFSIRTENEFRNAALAIFRYQAQHCQVYADFIRLLKIDPLTIIQVHDIPFLPVEFFKTHTVLSSEKKAELVFTSSGTTGQEPAKHFVPEPDIYHQSFSSCFEFFYGPVKDYCILALLPSYLERKGSSLVYMAEHLMRQSANPHNGFYLHQYNELAEKLNYLEKKGTKTLLIGVSYALLDLAEKHPLPLEHTLVMETGGMKGRRKELLREELHAILRQRFGAETIHSEYGMTELLSQAYSSGAGIFKCPPWMRVLTREMNDPLSLTVEGRTGGLNIIDLANMYSCSFIATKDLGRVYAEGSFEVLGRFDNSDLRGCNLMIS